MHDSCGPCDWCVDADGYRRGRHHVGSDHAFGLIRARPPRVKWAITGLELGAAFLEDQVRRGNYPDWHSIRVHDRDCTDAVLFDELHEKLEGRSGVGDVDVGGHDVADGPVSR